MMYITMRWEADFTRRITPNFAAAHESGCDVVDGARSRQRVPLG